MKHSILFLALCGTFVFQSCTSNEEILPPDSEMMRPVTAHLVVKYENRVYETDVVTVGDSVEYLDKEYAELYRTHIANAQDIAAVTSMDDTGNMYVEYFASEKKLQERYTFITVETIEDATPSGATRGGVIDMMRPNNASPILGVAELYDDRNFKDTELIVYAATDWANAIPRMLDLGFNDKCSSIKVFNRMNPRTYYTILSYPEGSNFPEQRSHLGSSLRPVLKCYENTGYKGKVIYCIAAPTGSSEVHMDYNLKNIGWNDKISALEWIIVYDLSQISGDNPLIPGHGKC